MSKNDEFPIELTDLEKFNLKISGNYYTDKEKNSVKALEAYLKLANAGDTEAMIGVGMIYEKRDTPFDKALPGGPDDDAALKWYKKCVDAQNLNGMENFAEIYINGKLSLPKDYKKAMQLYLKMIDIAKAKYETANSSLSGYMFAIGELYYKGGYGVEKNYAKALDRRVCKKLNISRYRQNI